MRGLDEINCQNFVILRLFEVTDFKSGAVRDRVCGMYICRLKVDVVFNGRYTSQMSIARTNLSFEHLEKLVTTLYVISGMDIECHQPLFFSYSELVAHDSLSVITVCMTLFGNDFSSDFCISVLTTLLMSSVRHPRTFCSSTIFELGSRLVIRTKKAIR